MNGRQAAPANQKISAPLAEAGQAAPLGQQKAGSLDKLATPRRIGNGRQAGPINESAGGLQSMTLTSARFFPKKDTPPTSLSFRSLKNSTICWTGAPWRSK